MWQAHKIQLYLAVVIQKYVFVVVLVCLFVWSQQYIWLYVVSLHGEALTCICYWRNLRACSELCLFLMFLNEVSEGQKIIIIFFSAILTFIECFAYRVSNKRWFSFHYEAQVLNCRAFIFSPQSETFLMFLFWKTHDSGMFSLYSTMWWICCQLK